MTHVPAAAAPARFLLEGGGEMGEHFRRYDWSAHPLGPPSTWPRSLTSALSIAIDSRYPMFVWWGPELFNFYNDGYIPVLGQRHPQALGRPAIEVWREIWHDVGPFARLVMEEGRATFADRMLLVMERNGYPEETYFTFSYSPIPADEGGIGGVFCACIEDTAQMLSERRLRTLRALAASAADARTAEEACRIAAQTLEENPKDLPFAALYLSEDHGGGLRHAGAAGIAADSPATPPELRLDGAGTPWPVARVLATGRPVVVEDLRERFGALPGGAWEAPPERALVVPIPRPGAAGPTGVLIAGLSPLRELDDDYRGFLDLVAAQAGSAIAHARAWQEARAREEALAELDRAKTAFFSNVSHEFRTPLTLMLGPARELADRGDLPEDVREGLAALHRNALRMLKMVNTLLEFSRIEAGRADARYVPTDLSAFTSEIGSLFRSAIEQAGLTLEVDCPPLGEPAWVDRDLWEKIVLNLMSNAFKFTERGGIRLALRESGDEIELEVRDTGVGIAAHELPRLFERFHRVEGARGRTFEGTGIGLALVQELVRLHGGRVEVESVEDQGSRFIVRIPAGSSHLPADRLGSADGAARPGIAAVAFAEEARRWNSPSTPVEAVGALAGAADSARAGPAGPSGEVARPRVLVVDDNADLRDYLARILAPGYEVDVAADGIQALERIRSRPPDLVLADVMMPRLDGFGLLRALRSDPALRPIPIVLLSARAGEDARVEGLNAGADDYVVKPFGARELLARVHGNVAMSRLRREAEERERGLREQAERANQRVLALLDQIEEGFVSFDHDWNYRYVNRCGAELLGRSPQQLIGRGLFAEFPELEGGPLAALLVRTRESGTPGRLVVEWRGRWWSTTAYSAEDRVTMFFQDITAQHQARLGQLELQFVLEQRVKERTAELKQANDQLAEFSYTVSHDLRAPLRAIRGYLEALLDEHPEWQTAATWDYSRRIAAAVNRMDRLIRDLLDYSQIARVEMAHAPLSLHGVAMAALGRRADDIASSGARVELEPDPGVANVVGHEPTLVRVIANLVDNALKFTPPGESPQVRLRLEPRGRRVRLWVEDRGIGIAREHVARIFEPFERLHRDEVYPGTGVGLSIVRKSMERMGGAVGVESEPGRGSRFWIELPIAATSPA